MDAAAVKHLGGIYQLQRSILVLQKVLAFACIEANWWSVWLGYRLKRQLRWWRCGGCCGDHAR